MVWFALDGWAHEILKRPKPQVEDLWIGSTSRAIDGTRAKSQQAEKEIWKSIQTPPLSYSDGYALRYLVRGGGEDWLFNHATKEEYGSKGTGAESGSAWTRITSSPSPKHGAAAIRVASAAYFGCDIVLDTDFSIFGWKNDATTGSFTSFGFTSDGDYWYGGTKNGATDPTDFTTAVAGGKPRFEGKDIGGSNAQTHYDTVRILNGIVMPDGWFDAQDSIANEPPGYPDVHLTGDIIPGSTKTVYGVAALLEHDAHVESGSYDEQRVRVKFRVEEA